MSVKEIEAAVAELVDAFKRADAAAALNLFSENVEIFDHVPRTRMSSSTIWSVGIGVPS